jgi:hypothetical protein
MPEAGSCLDHLRAKGPSPTRVSMVDIVTVCREIPVLYALHHTGGQRSTKCDRPDTSAPSRPSWLTSLPIVFRRPPKLRPAPCACNPAIDFVGECDPSKHPSSVPREPGWRRLTALVRRHGWDNNSDDCIYVGSSRQSRAPNARALNESHQGMGRVGRSWEIIRFRLHGK